MKKDFLKRIFATFLSLCTLSVFLNLAECKPINKSTPQSNHNNKINSIAQKSIKHNKNLLKTKKIGDIFCGDLKDFISKKTKNNSVLLFEYNPYHHECLPGYAKYFLELGYNVDVLTLDVGVDSFAIFGKNDKLKIYSYKDDSEIFKNKTALRSILGKYKHVFLNTIDWGNKRVFKCLNILNLPQSIIVSHSIGNLAGKEYSRLIDQKRVVTLGEFDVGTYVNPHYFGQIPKVKKNTKTNFLVVGNVWSKCRNYNQLFAALEQLSKTSLNFKVTSFGRGDSLDIPENLAPYIEFKGKLSYKDMYDEIKNADFILMLLDPKSKEHKRYTTTRVTGNAQLSYGFDKPVIINEEFADFYHFNSENSIIEKSGDLATAMEKAINCSQEEYSKLQDNLKITANEIFKKSLENLKAIIR